MNKTKKIISVICALAMMLSMFSMLTVANAEDSAKFTLTADKTQVAAGETVKLTLGYAGVPAVTDGKAAVSMLEAHIVVDPEIFDTTAITPSGSVANNMFAQIMGVASYNAQAGELRYVYNANSAAQYLAETEATLAEYTLTVKSDVAEDKLKDIVLSVSYTIISNETTDGTYTYASSNITQKNEEVTSESVKINEYVEPEVTVSPVRFTLTADKTQVAAGETVKLTLGYTGVPAVTDGKAAVSMLEAHIAVDPEIFDTTAITPSGSVANNMFAQIMGVASYNAQAGELRYVYNANSAAQYLAETEATLAEYTLTVKSDVAEDKLKDIVLSVSYTIISNETTDGTYTYASSNITQKNEEVVSDSVKINSTSTEPTPAPTVEPTVAPTVAPSTEPTTEPTAAPTVAPADYDLVTTVGKTGSVAAGDKFKIKTDVAENKTYEGTFDIVVQVYNKKGETVGFVVYNDLTAGAEETFYTAKDNKISVNTVDNIGESESDLLGNLVAKKVTK